MTVLTVSPSNIWKSASEVLRAPSAQRDKNLHIGGTLRDLYFSASMPATEGEFAKLLSDLEAAETDSKNRDA
ncbi:hypothetical protein P6U16_06670 [Rhizobium sp. 32-5/1]|uniref:hypothetical protein n=1 Tax=Rhizobium sp. 32-5/1 TaxID=3019602 RepID=UPI00240DC36B|nr:hypothetical protein [Rhizobium sp. 32-5/1]WEZ84322.1 hypothetical protein P6U16_06670 [Rhizobium sp. 32-5/1]